MPKSHRVEDVFKPNGVPTITYVYRSEHDFESQLRQALKTSGQIVSLSGPSKSGKTALISTVISSDDLIPLSGASISSAENLWGRVLNWMDVPTESTIKSATSLSAEANAKGGGSLQIPLVGGGSAEAGGKVGGSSTSEETTKSTQSSIDRVVREISNSSFVVFIDDFHYMNTELRKEVARQIKEVSEKGVKILTASVPHRSDDVVRGNSELRGRVRSINFDYWSSGEIREIPRIGFAALGMTLPDGIIEQFISEAFGSPQLMQSMCLQACYQLAVERTCIPSRTFDVPRDKFRKILEHTSSTTDFSSALDAMHPGPKLRGQERKQFTFVDGSTGDVYRCIFLAMAKEPPALSLRYDEILDRVRQVCIGDAPVGSSVIQALSQICEIAETTSGQRFIEWDENVLDISDPYFLYYLRCSTQLSRLKSPGVR